jgi:hypothetical protein
MLLCLEFTNVLRVKAAAEVSSSGFSVLWILCPPVLVSADSQCLQIGSHSFSSFLAVLTRNAGVDKAIASHLDACQLFCIFIGLPFAFKAKVQKSLVGHKTPQMLMRIQN